MSRTTTPPRTARSRHLLWATVMSGTLLLAAAAPAGATGPDGSGQLIYDVARVHLTAGGLSECDEWNAAGATIEFGFIVGDQLMIPVGQKPGDWTDFDPFIQVFWCDDEYFSIALQSHDLRDEYGPEDRWIDLFDAAHLAVTDRQLWDENGLTDVYASVDLTWEATGAPVTNTWAEGRHEFNERVAPASVTGTVVIEGWEGPWGDTLTFTADNTSEETTNLARVNDHWMPESGTNSPVSGTTTIAQADAWFVAPVPETGTCDSDVLYVNLGEDAYRGTGGDGKPPTLSGWLDVQTWHESGCDPETREQTDFVQQAIGVDPSQYDIDSLSSAWVNFDFPFYDGEAVVRTVTFDLAWTAEGDFYAVKGRDGSVVNGWERAAQLSGTVIDSWDLIEIDNLDRANMMTAHYLMK
jgi:hypothetical protein